MESKKSCKKITVLVFIFILVVQIVAMVYATSKREWLHMDEIYSYGLMHYDGTFIFDNENFLNNWHSKEYFEDYIVVNEDEKWDFSGVYENQIKDVHPPIYYLLLRIVSSFNIDNFSIWPGIILNIILFVFSSIFLYLIGKKIFNNNWCPLLLCLLNGFSLAMIEAVMFIRMYQLFILNVLMLVYWHMVKADKTSLNFKSDLLVLYLMVIIGFLSHYYYAFFAVILYIMYVIKFIMSKNYRELGKYTVVLGGAAITAILIFPYCIEHIFFSYRGEGVISNIFTLFSSRYLWAVRLNLSVINSEILNANLVNIIFLIIILALLVIIRNKHRKDIGKNDKLKYITIPLIVYLIISVWISPYVDVRYLMPIVPLLFIALLYVFYYLLRSVFNNKVVFVILLILVVGFSLTCMPKLSDNLYTYKGFKNLENEMDNGLSTIPWIYLHTAGGTQYNYMAEIYSIFTSVEETYIMLDTEVTAEGIIEALKNKDISNGVIFLIHNTQKDIMIEKIMKTNLFKENVSIGDARHFNMIAFLI